MRTVLILLAALVFALVALGVAVLGRSPGEQIALGLALFTAAFLLSPSPPTP